MTRPPRHTRTCTGCRGPKAASRPSAVTSRVITGSAARLLGALPAGQVQAIVTSPTRREFDRSSEVLFAQLLRVLRADGTLWLLTPDKHLPGALVERGWMSREVDWATPLRVDPAGRARLHLFVKGPSYFYNSQTAGLFLAPRTRAALARKADRWSGCSWSPGHRRELVRLCILAGSSRVACGTCGAPYTRTPEGARRPTCAHSDPGGRCLILDPFCHPGSGAHELAVRLGRAFLGITDGGHR